LWEHVLVCDQDSEQERLSLWHAVPHLAQGSRLPHLQRTDRVDGIAAEVKCVVELVEAAHASIVVEWEKWMTIAGSAPAFHSRAVHCHVVICYRLQQPRVHGSIVAKMNQFH